MPTLNSLNEALDRRRAKLLREQRKQKEGRHGIVDLTVSQQQPNDSVRSSISNSKPTFISVNERKGIQQEYDSDSDEYSRYNQMFDGNADELIKASGATIISSSIELTDSSGRNRTIVRRNDNGVNI